MVSKTQRVMKQLSLLQVWRSCVIDLIGTPQQMRAIILRAGGRQKRRYRTEITSDNRIAVWRIE